MQVYHRLHVVEEEEYGRNVEQEIEREDQGEETAHANMNKYGDGMNGANLSQSAYVCEDTTTPPKKCARHSVDVAAGVRIVRSHAIMDVVIGLRVVFCHPLVHNFGFSTSCPNSHLVVML